MNRRRFLSNTVNTLGSLGLGLGLDALEEPVRAHAELASHGELAKPATPYNVLIVMSDQHRRSCMGVAGDSVAITPNLDRLAQESVRFTNVYCTNPLCAPSRASMMTGLYTHHLGTVGSQPYSPRHKTMAGQFSQAGYLTALIGKMHFMDAQIHGFDYQLEFNDWLQTLGPRAKLYADEVGSWNSGCGIPQIDSLWQGEGDPWNGHRDLDNRLGVLAVGRPSERPESDHFESFVERETISFLEKHAKVDEPFFLVTSFLKPHDPFMPAKKFADMFDPENIKLPATWGKADLANLPEQVRQDIETSWATPELLKEPEARKRVASYYGSLAQMDDCLGRVLKALTRLHLDRKTIVVYTSDHGEMLGALGLWNKFQFYEGSCGVPLLIRKPDVAPGVCHTPLSLISLAATLSELCSVPLAKPNDGQSFAELLTSPDSQRDYGPVFAEYNLGKKTEKYMIREGSLKYSYWVYDKEELYDLKTDPEEMNNLAVQDKYRDTVDQLKRKLFAWYTPVSRQTP
jgi:choline-sulfatase